VKRREWSEASDGRSFFFLWCEHEKEAKPKWTGERNAEKVTLIFLTGKAM
jgi:hypothetical protein